MEECKRALADVLKYTLVQSPLCFVRYFHYNFDYLLLCSSPDKKMYPYAAQQYSYRGIAFNGYGVHDSLTHAFSLFQPPQSATKENHHFLYAAAVTRMINTLTGKRFPTKTCIVFDEYSNPPGRITISTAPTNLLLGSTIPNSAQKSAIQDNLYKWMHSISGNPAFADPTKSDLNPKGLKNGQQLFGHCAETRAVVLKLQYTKLHCT